MVAIDEAAEDDADALDALLVVLRQATGQGRQGPAHEMELVGVQILTAVGRDGQRRPLGVDAEEVEVHETGRDAAGLQDRFGMASTEHLQRRQTLLGHVHALDDLQLLEEGGHGVDDDGRRARQSLHHVRQGTARVVHHIKVVLHVKQVDERRNRLPHGESGQCVLVAHHQQLAHLDGRLQLLALIRRVLQSYSTTNQSISFTKSLK